MADIITVHVTFEVPAIDDLPSYRDTLIFDVDEYGDLPKGALDAAKQERHAAWMASVIEAQNRPEPTPEELDRLVREGELVMSRRTLEAGLAAVEIKERQLADESARPAVIEVPVVDEG